MSYVKLMCAGLAILALNACVGGFIFPVPLGSGSSSTTQDSDRGERR